MNTVYASARYNNQQGKLEPLQRFGDLLKLRNPVHPRWENGQELYLGATADERTLLTRVVHQDDQFLYVYLRASGPQLTERRTLPRLVCEIPATLIAGVPIKGIMTSMHWTGFSILVENESDRLKLKLYKSNAVLTCQLGVHAIQANVHFIHGKSLKPSIGVVITSISLADFEHLSEYIAAQTPLAHEADHPANWIDRLLSRVT